MHIDEIMKNYKPVYPDSGLWEDTFQMIRDYPVDMKVVEDLLEDLENHGEFREPIVLTTYEEYLKAVEDYKYSEGDTTDPYVPHVSNGTHRVFAHYLSKNKDVKVQYGWGDVEADNLEEYPTLATKLVFPPDLDEETIYALFDTFRSFKLTEELWMVSELVSTHYNNCHVLWAFGTKDVGTLVPYMEQINAKVVALTGEMGIVCTAKTEIINSEEEDEIFFDRKFRKPQSDV